MRPVRFVLAIVALGGTVALLPGAAQDDWMAPAARDFPLAGGNLANQRFSALTSIDRTNVSRLGGAWRVPLASEGTTGNMQGAPVVLDGVMYIGTGSGNVLALDAATGERIWEYRSSFGAQTNRGVTVAEGKVFTGQSGARLVALDQKTGSLAWETRIAERGGTPGAVIYADGRVFAGISGGESGVRGQFGAYDPRTGRELWKAYTIPGPGELGHETWEGDSWTRGGGPLWTHPAVDPDLGLVYVPVGNAYPDQDGAVRGGDNLFTASILALDVQTGAYRWHFQEVHHDLWDYDNPVPPVLADVPYQGQVRKVLIHGGKNGMTYVLDRVTGVPVVDVEERPVPQVPSNKTALTQPFPRGDAPVPICPEPGSVAEGADSSCVFGAFRPDRPVVMTPGTQGGVNWAPMAFSSRTNLFYVPGSIINSQFSSGFSRPAGQPRAGTLSAMNPTTNKIVWQVRTTYPLATGSGLLVTASGLLFNGQSDGKLVVYDVENGHVLWHFQTDAGADAPVVTYEVNGDQYVAILAGGNNFQLSERGDSLWAFALDGRLAPAPPPPAPPRTQPAAGRRGGGAAPAGGRGGSGDAPGGRGSND